MPPPELGAPAVGYDADHRDLKWHHRSWRA
jgi:hypothetical protein